MRNLHFGQGLARASSGGPASQALMRKLQFWTPVWPEPVLVLLLISRYSENDHFLLQSGQNHSNAFAIQPLIRNWPVPGPVWPEPILMFLLASRY